MEFRVSISSYQLDTDDKICWCYSSFQLGKNSRLLEMKMELSTNSGF